MSIIAEPEVIGFHRRKLNWVKSAALYYRQRRINSSSTIAPARLAPVRLSLRELVERIEWGNGATITVTR